MWRNVIKFALILLSLGLAASCQTAPPVVKIGLVAPFEGANRAVGYDVIYSARLAARQINQSGGINGKRVSLVALDDAGNVEQAQQAAVSLAIDPDVTLVLGHWNEETTTAAAAIYAEADLPLIRMGEPPFAAVDPTELPASFLQAYAELTPFEEVAGNHAGAAYDAMQLIIAGIAKIEGEATRKKMGAALSGLEIEGMSGAVYLPEETD